MIDILVVIMFPDFEKVRLCRDKKLCDFILSRENFGNLWSFLGPKEKQASIYSSRKSERNLNIDHIASVSLVKCERVKTRETRGESKKKKTESEVALSIFFALDPIFVWPEC